MRSRKNLWYSSTGSVYELVESVVEGVEKVEAEVGLRNVPDLSPEEGLASNVGSPDGLPDVHQGLLAMVDDVTGEDVARSAGAFQGQRVVKIAAALKAGWAA